MTMRPPGRNANAHFGEGIFRRRLRLIAEAGQVRAGLEDTNHAMRLVLRHDGERVTDVEPRMTRIPVSTCPGAAGPLRAFVGLPLRLAGQNGFLEKGEVGDADAPIQGGVESLVEGAGFAEQADRHVAPSAGLDLHQAPFAVAAHLGRIAVGLDLDDGIHEAIGILLGIE